MADSQEPVTAGEPADPTVYVSRRGRTYHQVASCTTLFRRPGDVRPIRLSEAQAQGRKACLRCRPPG